MANPLYDSLFAKHRSKEDTFLWLEQGEVLSYGDFLALAERYAALLGTLGVQPGDRVAMQVDKSPKAMALYAACVKSAAICLPMNTAYTVDELQYLLEDSQPRLLICGSDRKASLLPSSKALGFQLLTMDADGGGSFDDTSRSIRGMSEPVACSDDDIAAILYTSGTTGQPKGAMLSHRNLLSNALALAPTWQFTESDVLLHALPIFHAHGLFVATHVTLAVGSSMIFLPRFDLDTVVDVLPRASVMMGVPTFYTRLLDDPRLNRSLVSRMRLFISGSAPLLAETHMQFEARTGQRIIERYGLTETGMNTSNPYDGDRKPGTVGLPLADIEVRITDTKTKTILGTDDIGQVEVRGPNVFKGYWRNPEKTAADMRPDGWFVTGDLGLVDADGYLHIVGRDKDLIISGGYNIYPKEIEQLLDAQPGIRESAVVGVPHPDFGETVLAILVPDETGSHDPKAISYNVSAKLARFKHPREYVFVESLPRNAMGKVQKAALRKSYSETFM